LLKVAVPKGADVTWPILLVEDDPDLREALVDVLAAQGFQMLEACNGQEALELLRTRHLRPTLILLDLMMPVMDGRTFLHERGIDPSLARVPVVVLTAQRTAAVAIEGEVTAVLDKPFALKRLLEIIHDVCQQPFPTTPAPPTL
jgi:CheY-like chemotaxis protein